ncbi:MAG: helix-turn-helix transcriptional regulator [Clostridium sp.]|nr:helix-turn-helix transcriptional regulator [Clostridium sp.]
MPVSYDKLFALMESKGIKKIDLRLNFQLNPKTVDSLTKNKSVTVDTIMKLCEILNCQPGDILEYVPDENNITASK